MNAKQRQSIPFVEVAKLEDAAALEPLPNNRRAEAGALRSHVSVGRAGASPALDTHSKRQRIDLPIDITPPFDAGSSDGYSDALHGHPKDAAARFQSWHRSRPASDFAEYETGYLASYEQVRS